jgi:hypothetical protein
MKITVDPTPGTKHDTMTQKSPRRRIHFHFGLSVVVVGFEPLASSLTDKRNG